MAVRLGATALPSAGLTTRFSATISGYPQVTNLYIAWGISSGAPATYGGVTSGTIRQCVFADILSISVGIGTASLSLQTDIDAIGSAGDDLWFMAFGVSPSSGTVPLAVAGPFPVSV
jgi:hypothetical protein